MEVVEQRDSLLRESRELQVFPVKLSISGSTTSTKFFINFPPKTLSEVDWNVSNGLLRETQIALVLLTKQVIARF
jgi:hypothetical protein